MSALGQGGKKEKMHRGLNLPEGREPVQESALTPRGLGSSSTHLPQGEGAGVMGAHQMMRLDSPIDKPLGGSSGNTADEYLGCVGGWVLGHGRGGQNQVTSSAQGQVKPRTRRWLRSRTPPASKPPHGECNPAALL